MSRGEGTGIAIQTCNTLKLVNTDIPSRIKLLFTSIKFTNYYRFLEKFNCQKEFFYLNDKIFYKWKADWNKQGNYQDVGHGNAVIDVLIAIYENNQ